MNAMNKISPVVSSTSNCFTHMRSMGGAKLTEGLEADVRASTHGVYFVSDETKKAWIKYVALDYYNPPVHTDSGIIFRMSMNQKGFLVSRAVFDQTCFLRVTVYDKAILQLTDGDLETSSIIGCALRHKLVWKKHPVNGNTVGFDALYQMNDGDVVGVVYPGGADFLACRGGKVTVLAPDHKIVVEWHKKRREASFAGEVEQARARALEFPKPAEWAEEISKYAELPLEVKEAFFETLFANISEHLEGAVVGEEGVWEGRHMFMLHTLHDVTKYMPREQLKVARRVIRDMESRNNATVPLSIVSKFGIERTEIAEMPSNPINPDAVARRKRREANLAQRAAENRAHVKGATGAKDGKKGKKKN